MTSKKSSRTAAAAKSRRAAGPRKAANESVTAHVGATVVAAGIGVLIADTGALAAADYRINAHLGADGTALAGKSIVLQHRDAANTGTVKELGRCPAGGAVPIVIPRVTLAANERIRAVAGSVAFAAGENATAHISATAIPT